MRKYGLATKIKMALHVLNGKVLPNVKIMSCGFCGSSDIGEIKTFLDNKVPDEKERDVKHMYFATFKCNCCGKICVCTEMWGDLKEFL